MALPRNLGMKLLAIWLIAYGVIQLMHLSFDGLGTVMAALAIAAGVCLLMGK